VNENPDYWNTIATVIPVIALTYATALKRRDWHKLKPMARRWTAIYGAVVAAALTWAEWVSLRYLQQKTTNALDESLTLLVVGSVAVQVLAVPIAPLLVLAIHDLHPKVLSIKRKMKANERRFKRAKKDYEQVLRRVGRSHMEMRIAGAEQAIRNPSLAFEEDGAVRNDYRTRVVSWGAADEFRRECDELLAPAQAEFKALGKDLKKSRKDLNKTLRAMTKEFVKVTDMGRST
jgi:DNA-binding ferritin-like protein (Dps family)